jgi:hypothetical protein
MRLRLFIRCFLLFAIATSAFAQTIDLAKDRVPMTDLTGPWRFHTGDNPAWSNPSFDDSAWPLLLAGKPWTAQGYPTTTGVAWYRIRILLSPQDRPLALFLPYVDDSAQVFANGRLIGQLGGMPPHARVFFARRLLFPIPMDAIPSGQPLILAVRVWHWPKVAGFGGGLTSLPRIGNAHALALWQRLLTDQNFYNNAGLSFDVYADFLTALAGFGLFFLRRNEREYLWWGISQLFWALFVINVIRAIFRPVPYFEFYAWYAILFILANAFQFEFYVTFLRQRHGWLFRAAIFLLLLGQTLNLLYRAAPTHSLPGILAAFTAASTEACILAMLWIGARRHTFGAALLVVPYGAALLAQTLLSIVTIPALAASPWAQQIFLWLDQTIRWPIPTGAFQITGDLEMFAVLVILVLRYTRSRQEEERLESELEAARTVQKVLIPDEIPSVPGFEVQTIYRPASQVGGDFFQIIPLASGSILLTIGDVSGKGMPAAMTVSLLVGTFRTLAHYTQSPGEILRAMNQRMLARSGGGFTTCLVLRIDPDGTMIGANAGHPAPYLDSHEIPLDNGLPLGLHADAHYSESTVSLRPGEQLTLLTDGVPEARNAEGALFGFDRAQTISAQSAESIARAAQQHGQQDDITVLTVTRLTSEQQRFSSRAVLAPSPA